MHIIIANRMYALYASLLVWNLEGCCFSNNELGYFIFWHINNPSGIEMQYYSDSRANQSLVKFSGKPHEYGLGQSRRR